MTAIAFVTEVEDRFDCCFTNGVHVVLSAAEARRCAQDPAAAAEVLAMAERATPKGARR